MATGGQAPYLFEFQSSPGPKAGRYLAEFRAVGADTMFQSSPGPKAGRYLRVSFGLNTPLSPFQSSPGPKAGATSRPTAPSCAMFQSSPGPKAGRYHTV